MALIRFGEFELDEQTLELRRKGALIRVQQQPARVLAFLLRQAGQLVTRQQIQRTIWGQETFVDFEQSLNFCIRQIRITLNDHADKPLFIETLPRLGYRFIGSVEKIGDGETERGRNRVRIGLLPIEDLGGSVEDYFAIGLTEDMISALSRIDPARLRVTIGPRAACGILPREELDRLQREFDLDYLLRGSVRRSADAIRICAQLIDLKDKSVLWSEVYDRKSSDLLAVQEEVTRRVSQSLALELLPEASGGSRKYARSSAAYDAYLRGRFFWHKMTADAIRSSIAHFNEALTIDPGFAPAYAGLADCYAQMGSIRVGTMKPLEALTKARTYLQRATELDDTLADAHCTSGLIKSWYQFDCAGAERDFHLALSLAPGHVTALIWQSLYLSAMGRHEEAVASVQRARESEPLSPTVNMYLGVARSHAGQYDLAIRQLNQTIELDPHNYRPYMFLGRTLAWVGRYQAAIAAFQHALSINSKNLEALAFMGAAKAAAGDRTGALSILERVIAAESPMEPAVLVACIYAGLGEASQMFAWLERAVERKSVPIYIVLLCEEFHPYRSDPRLRILLDSVGLPSLVDPKRPAQCSD
jgi:TolB-like protein/Tfp pilus assembly protein PilF